MLVAGIICEYNPFHLGHAGHIAKTRNALGSDTAIVCIMSGNFVQRGEPAIFNKHSRAQTAIQCGADLVIELPTPFALSSAERFAYGGVSLLHHLGVCDYLSFGSETGVLEPILEAATAITTTKANTLIVDWLKKGLPYAAAQQKAADEILGEQSNVFRSPNNLLGIAYLKAITACGTEIKPITVMRTGGAHDSDTGYSASRIRKMILSGDTPWDIMPDIAAHICKKEIAEGRGPISTKHCEIAMLARLRMHTDFATLPDASEGLDKRIAQFAKTEATTKDMLLKIKTKRYAMSRLRRMLMCAALNITAEDTIEPPPYIRILALNQTGMTLLNSARKKATLPIITKPASAAKMSGRTAKMFYKEAATSDFYALSYPNEKWRTGGSEWKQTPIIIGK
ncbi:MAG: nucleotidyltransferase family protein [Oscillospiraceae bacterium]|nr:nucleotidyltransferase family protein [Oscillospiraceae bacterium]